MEGSMHDHGGDVDMPSAAPSAPDGHWSACAI